MRKTLLKISMISSLIFCFFSSAALADAPIVVNNISPPTIAASGQTLTASIGVWQGTPPITFSYQWTRCDSTGYNCVNISGATSDTYVLTAADTGSVVRISITAVNAGGTELITSEGNQLPTTTNPPITTTTTTTTAPTSSNKTTSSKTVSSSPHTPPNSSVTSVGSGSGAASGSGKASFRYLLLAPYVVRHCGPTRRACFDPTARLSYFYRGPKERIHLELFRKQSKTAYVTSLTFTLSPGRGHYYFHSRFFSKPGVYSLRVFIVSSRPRSLSLIKRR
jgi:hypothetical protein